MPRHHAAVRLLAAAALLVASLLPAARLRAQVTTFTSYASWLGAVSGVETDSFDDLPLAVASSPLARATASYAYSASAANDLFVVEAAGDRSLSSNTATDLLAFSGFSPAVRGVGGFFFGTDDAGTPISGTLRVSWTTMAGNGFLDLTNPSPASFLGLVATGSILTLSVAVLTPTSTAIVWPAVSALSLGVARPATTPPSTTVPEPGTVGLLAAGLLITGLMRRRVR